MFTLFRCKDNVFQWQSCKENEKNVHSSSILFIFAPEKAKTTL